MAVPLVLSSFRGKKGGREGGREGRRKGRSGEVHGTESVRRREGRRGVQSDHVSSLGEGEVEGRWEGGVEPQWEEKDVYGKI